MMNNYNWQDLLQELSKKLIANRDEYHQWELTEEMMTNQWLGYPGASEKEITQAESRLGVKLPPSYRQFLCVSNGWFNSDWTDLELYGTEQIEWFKLTNPDWIWPVNTEVRPSISDEEYFVYGEEQDCVNLRCEYLENALEISSDSGDGDIFLLIPDVILENEEWEAWHLGSKLPGAYRYRSFYELMEKVLEQGAFIY